VNPDCSESLVEGGPACSVDKNDDIQNVSLNGSEQKDELSTSEHSEGASTVDLAEKREQQVRRSLCFAILSACGLIALLQVVGWLFTKFTRDSSKEDVVVEMAVDEAAGAAREGVVTQAVTTAGGGAANPAV